MSKRSLIIGGIIIIALVFIVVLFLLIINLNNKQKQESVFEENTASTNATSDEPLVVILEDEEKQEEPAPEPEPVKDAATLTQEVYDINGPIGTLNIPKTGLNTQVYSKVSGTKMETMPCFLYTTGGLNQKGFTLFVGHNRENGLLFSNNNMLEENDVFYFTDLNGVEKKYTVFSKFVTASDDVSFYNNPVDSPVVAMQCCLTANTSDKVIIVMGKADN